MKRNKKVFVVNSVVGFGSTGKIIETIAESSTFDTIIYYGRKNYSGKLNPVKFTSFFDNAFGAIRTILFDNNINICKAATKRLIEAIKKEDPDIIHLHNIHGYYLNIQELFKFLKEYNKPVVWSLHDCWAFTGYCPYFDNTNCEKYITLCKDCKHIFSYPFSLFKQQTEKEYLLKKELFTSINNLTIVTPSDWLMSKVKLSFLRNIPSRVIHNGINNHNAIHDKQKDFGVIAVANYWTEEKGTDELRKFISLLDKDIKVTIIGKLNNKKGFENCNLIDRTDDKEFLFRCLGKNHFFINTTLEDNFPTINIEALSCGTPVITYATGGSTEMLDEKTGISVIKHDYKTMAAIINEQKNNYTFNGYDCIKRASEFGSEKMVKAYEDLYESLLNKDH